MHTLQIKLKIMKAGKYLFYLSSAVFALIFSVGVHAVWNEGQANMNELTGKSPTIIETNAAPLKNDLPVLSPDVSGSITVRVKRFVSRVGNKCYRYTVSNNAAQEISGMSIGTEKTTDLNELVELPLGWSESSVKAGFEESRKSRSAVEPVATEDQDKIFVTTKSFRLAAGKTRNLEVCVSQWDANYQTSHWIAYLYDGSEAAGKLLNID